MNVSSHAKRACRDVAEMRFEWLLQQRGIGFVGESELATQIETKGKLPDFCCMIGSNKFLVEVKSFQELSPLDGTDHPYAAPGFSLTRMTSQVKNAAAQLKPYKNDDIPCLIVLDNYRKIGLHLGPIDLIELLGRLQFVVPVQGSGEDFFLAPGGKKVLSPNQKTYISAVAVNIPKHGHAYYEDDITERPMRLRILHNPFAHIPLPAKIFSDPEDEHLKLAGGTWQTWMGNGRLVPFA